ncbi:uncharacterized protein LOC126264576 [Aethina tumida]|uniref:uncharacterized protein LOC126264576 n=1 Tax=Aethina tumida TaxID=116153 RepID=UPI002147250E|nr:uncharacterized protein LOC126264576 [Aethina tumida]
MKSFAILLDFVAVALAFPSNIVEDESGQQFYLVPLRRHARDTTWDIAKGPHGTDFKLGHEGVLAGKGGHELTAGGGINKHIGQVDATTYTGSLGYHHIPTDSNIRAVVSQTPHFGRNVGIEASRTLWAPDKNTKLEAYGGVSRSYTPWGNTKPEGNIGLSFSHGHNLFGG